MPSSIRPRGEGSGSPSGPDESRASPPQQRPRPQWPCQLSGCGEAGLTSHVIRSLRRLASSGMILHRCARLGRGCGRCIVCVMMGQARPDTPGVRVGSRHRRAIVPPPRDERSAPLTAGVMLEHHPAPGGPGPRHQYLAEGAIPAWAHPEPAGLAACGVCTGHKAQPGGTLAAMLAVCRSGTAARRAVAVSGPMPGIACNR
jgi:hypothetical protein